MKFFSIKSLASRGWLTVFLTLLGLLFSMILMGYGVIFGQMLMQIVITVLPIGIYEIFRGRGKYKGMSLNEYKAHIEQSKENKMYIVLGIVGAGLSGAITGHVSDQLGL